MSLKFTNILVTFMDGDTKSFRNTTRAFISEGVLHIYRQDGEDAFEAHLGSYPLINIKEWTKAPAYGY